MRKIIILMTILMGFTMSLFLSLLGTLMSGHFTITAWLISFFISFLISLIIGFAVPVKKTCDAVCKKLNTIPESPKGNFISSLVSDFIYTPAITISMVVIMVKGAQKQLIEQGITEHLPSIPQILIPSLAASLLVGYILILIAQPIFLKLLIGKNGMPPRPENPDK